MRDMELYHVSPTAGLTVLRPSVTEFFGKPRQVCLTALKPMALLYGVRHFEYTYGYTREGKLCYEEYFPDALEELYRGKRASLYRCAWREGMETTAIPNEYVSAAEVPVEEETPIPDVLEALLEQEEQNEISKKRQLNALRMEMQKAVQEENFERAAELRDQIHSLEQN